MLRKSLVALAAVGALALASCGSTAGTAETGSGASGASSVVGSATAGPASASGGGATGAEQTGNAGADSDSGSGTGATTITAGGDIEGQSAAWFSAFCTGLGPVFTTMMNMDPSATGAAKQQTYVTNFNAMGDAFTAAAKTLGALPPPTFDNGDKLASTMVQTLASAGPVMKQAAEDIAAADATDEQALDAAIAKANEQTSGVLDGMDQFDLDDATQQQLREIPACKAFMTDNGGGSSDDGASPTTG